MEHQLFHHVHLLEAEPMLKPSRSHQNYVAFVRTRLATEKEPARHLPAKAKLLILDLTLALPILTLLYASDGRPAIPPEDLLRSLIAMLLCGITSIDTWVAQMRTDPFYAIISGFAPTQVPGVGTFYEFMDRLLGLDAHRVQHLYRPKPRQQRAKKDKQASKDKNKDTPKHQHIVAKLAARFLRQATPPTDSAMPTWHCDPAKFARAEQVIQAIFYACIVSKSMDLGLIDLHHLCVSGDGSKLRTWANPNGRKHCKCDNKGKKPDEWCNCERYYRDPAARWGYDSSHDCWVYGHTYYELTAYSLNSTVELPLFILLADNCRHDSVLGLFAMHQACDNLGFPIQVASFDKASDALGFYQLGYERWHTKLVIPLNERNTGNFTFEPPVTLTPEGTPCCPDGRPMNYWGYCPDRQRLKWRCPLKAGTQTERQKPCACQGTCSPSAYGRVVYTYPKTNYRLFTPLPRDTELWREHYDHHGCVERSHKRKKYDYLLKQTRTAGRERWFLRVMLAAICQHLDAWLALSERTEASP
jgi:hypothetical protein